MDLSETTIFISGIIFTVFGWVFKSLIIEPLRESIKRLTLSIDETNRRFTEIVLTVTRDQEQIKTLYSRINKVEKEVHDMKNK